MLKRLSILLMALIITFTSINFENVYADETEDYKTFSQLDERWASYVYGGGATIGSAGCFITSFAVVMAYANPDLRDVNTFNPKILAQRLTFDGDLLYQTSVNSVDSTFHWESNESTSGGNSAEARIKELLEAGKYVIVRAGPPIASGSTHFSPIVGWDDDKDQPKIMDVAGGNHPTWEEWAPYVNRLDVCSSDIQDSLDAFESNTDDIQDNAPNSDEEREALEQLIEEWDLAGMPAINSIADLQQDIELKDRSELSLTEQRRTQEIGDAIESQGVSIPTWFSHILFFIGVCLVFYSVLLLVAMLFDYSNQFFETSLVTMLTFGTCRIVDEDYLKDNPNSSKHTAMGKERAKITNLTIKMMVFRIALLMLIGLLIMSGTVQYYVVLVINWALSALRS